MHLTATIVVSIWEKKKQSKMNLIEFPRAIS